MKIRQMFLIFRIERALGFKLHDWQRQYILTGKAEPPRGRRHGRTTAYCVRLALDTSRSYTLGEVMQRADLDLGYFYRIHFRDTFLLIRGQLERSGLKVCEIVRR